MRRRDHRLRHAGVSRSALAALLVAQPLATAPLLAQAFQGSSNVVFGSAEISTSVNTTDIRINSETNARTTINWTPLDTGTGGGAINFLPNGATANFIDVNDGQVAPATVLNRIIAADPTRAIAFAGNVNSAANVAVWFYAPGGLLINGTAQFNVGSLLLTANDPATTGGDFITGGNRFTLSAATGSTAGVNIDPGAQINALANNSYVIAVAPQIEQRGTINVNGSAALVAAESATLTLNAGLFDISVTQGTSAAGEVLTHTGTTTGPAAGQGENQRIYLVAVPKNDAITMFVGDGTGLGFDIAGAASVVGNTVVLSAGHNVAASGFGEPFSDVPASPTEANIIIGRGNYTSAVTARATSSARVEAVSLLGLGATANFAADLSLRGGTEAIVSATGLSGYGAVVDVTGTLRVSADAQFGSQSTALTRTGGTAAVVANSQSQIRADNIIVSADGVGDDDGGGNGVGGSARVQALDGVVNAGGGILVFADGSGSRGFSQAPGRGTGGEAYIEATGTGLVTAAVNSFVNARGNGGDNSDGGGGDGQGGVAFVRTAAAAARLTFNSSLAVDASGNGGQSDGGRGGDGTGGTASVFAASGSVRVNDAATVSAEGVGGSQNSDGNFDNGSGGNGLGGSARLFASAGGLVQAQVGGTVTASGFGGNGLGTGAGGAGSGGAALIDSAGAGTRIRLSDPNNAVAALVSAEGQGGTGAAGGAGAGGSARAVVRDNASLLIGQFPIPNTDPPINLIINNIEVLTSGRGGAGTTGNGGAGTGGGSVAIPAVLAETGGNLTVTGRMAAIASGFEGGSATGRSGTAAGGNVVVRAQTGAALSIAGDLEIQAGASGGAPARIGDAAAGGRGELSVGLATIDIGDSVLVRASAGGGGRTEVGGAGTGGSAIISATAAGGTITIGGSSVELLATGTGDSAGGAIGIGGVGRGGGGPDRLQRRHHPDDTHCR